MYIHKLYLLGMYGLLYSTVLFGMVTIIPNDGTPIKIKKRTLSAYPLLQVPFIPSQQTLPLPLSKHQSELLFYSCNTQFNTKTTIKNKLYNLPITEVQNIIINSDYLGNDILLQSATSVFVKRITKSLQTLWQWKSILHQNIESFPDTLIYTIDSYLRKKIIPKIATLNLQTTQKKIISCWHETPISCIGISPNNKILINGSQDGNVYFYDTNYGASIAAYHAPHRQKIISIHFDQINKYAASVSTDNIIQLWNLHYICPYKEPFEGSTCSLSSDGSIIAIAHNNSITIQNIKTREILYTNNQIKNTLKKLYFNTTNQLLACYSKCNSSNTYHIELWNIEKNKQITIDTKKKIVQLYFSQDNTKIIGIDHEGNHTAWAIKTGRYISSKKACKYPRKLYQKNYTASTLVQIFAQASYIHRNISGKLKKQHNNFNRYAVSADGTSVAISTCGHHIIETWQLFNKKTLNSLHMIEVETNINQLLLITALTQYTRKKQKIDLSKYPTLSNEYANLAKPIRKLLQKSLRIKY